MLRVIAALLLIWPVAANAVGAVPAVNSDMGCAVAGQTVQYTGSALGCVAPSRPTTVVNSLPTCNAGAQGQMYLVTDALLPVSLATVANGGAVKIGVLCNGTNWIVN